VSGGRPTDYKAEFAAQAAKLCELGATDADLAEFFDVSERTINRWQVRFPEFCRSLKVGKETADDRVERSLFHRANGYTYDAVKIFMPAGAKEPHYAPYREHVPPDTTACIFWLKNRRKEQWRDRQELTGPDGKPVEVELKADESFAAVIAALESVGRTKAGDTSGKSAVAEPGETGAATTSG
jgi:hypothetical protein